MASTLTTFDFALKERYTEEKVEDLSYAENPFLGMIKKNEEFSGDGYNVPVITVPPQGVAAANLSTAQTGRTNVVGFKFLLTAGDYYGAVDIGDKVIKASRNNPGALLENKTAETDGLYQQMADSIAIYAFGNGGNALGRESGAWTTPSTTLILSDISQAANFEVGMIVVSDTVDGGEASGTVNSGTNTITAVDRETGTLTGTAWDSAITGFAASDYLFRSGDYTGASTVLCIEGLGSFITATNAPAALYGMTRTSDPQRLAGCRIAAADIAGLGIERRIKKLGSYMTGRYKGPGADVVFLHPEDWEVLETSLEARGWRSLTDESTRFGYEAISATVGGRKVKIYSDRHCTKGTAFLLKQNSWTMYSMLKLIHQINGDGLTMLRKSTTNDYEFRLQAYPCMATNAPGWNGRVTLP